MTLKHASDASKENHQLTNHHSCNQPLPIPDKPNIRLHADLFGPILELRHPRCRALGRRPRGREVVDVHRHRERQSLRGARHVEDDVDEEDLERSRHAPRAEIAVEMAKEPLARTLAPMEAVEQERPDPWCEW